MASLSSVLDRTVAEHASHPAIRLDDLVLDYAELREAAGRVTSLLSSLGVVGGRPGRHHAAQRPRVPHGLLRRAGRRGRGGADEPAAEEPGGRATT